MVFSIRRYKVEGMATNKSVTPGRSLPWAGKPVSPDQVEQELMSLWHLASDNMRISQNRNVRTSVLNFRRLISSSSRVIIDSNDFTSPEERIQKLSEILQVTPNCALSDLNWRRITPWRELIAQFFDVAEYRPYLVNVDSIEIEHTI